MKRNILLAAAVFACASARGAGTAPAEPDEILAAPEPTNPVGPAEPPATSAPAPLPGKPAPPPGGVEGTGRPVPAKTDTELIQALTSALLDDPSAPKVQALTISVKDGRATLKGTARSQQDKDAAAAKAAAVPGLRSVSNMITVTP